MRPATVYFCDATKILSVTAPTGFFVITGSLFPFISVSTVRSYAFMSSYPVLPVPTSLAISPIMRFW